MIDLKTIVIIVCITILGHTVVAVTLAAKTDADRKQSIGQCEALYLLGKATPKTKMQCYWLMQEASVNSTSRADRFDAKKLMKVFEAYKNY